MNSDFKLIPMSRRALELLYLLAANSHDASQSPNEIGTVIPFELFVTIAQNFENRKHLSAYLSNFGKILRMYGFHLTRVSKRGYICHKTPAPKISRFDQRFYGVPTIDREILRGEK